MKEIFKNIKELEKTKNISINTSKTMIGSDDPQFKRIHHNFHHIVLYIKDTIMKENCKNYLEIGTHYGHSLCNMLQSDYSSRYMGVDLFKKWGDGEIDDMLSLAQQNVNLFNKNKYECKLIKGDSKNKDTIKKVREFFPNGIDLLFIDGDHTYHGIENDFKNYFPLVNSGGFIVFDDYLPKKTIKKVYESHKSIDNIIEKNKNKIIDIGIVDDLVDVYKLKTNPYIDLKKKNIDYIIKKI